MECEYVRYILNGSIQIVLGDLKINHALFCGGIILVLSQKKLNHDEINLL